MSAVYNQRKLVERNQAAVIRCGEKWEPVDIEWYTKWKTYTDIEYEEPPQRELYPGPIDNSRLQGKYEEELRPGLVEEQDFVLLRKTAADVLFSAYGGGPRFSRDVINVGTVYSPNYQVAVYRVRVEAYLCNSASPAPDANDQKRRIVRFFSKDVAYGHVIEALMEGFGVKLFDNAVRCWIRDTEDAGEQNGELVMADTTLSRDSPSNTSSEVMLDTFNRSEGGESKRARVGRLLTADVTDHDGPWKFLRHGHQGNIRELQGNADSVCFLLEVAPERKPQLTDWPRSKILDGWKQSLRVGDIFDAKDQNQGKWYAAMAKEISPTGDLSVHFKGWAARFDEVIPACRVVESLDPLYTHTADRREWGVDDKVEYRVTPPEVKAVWIVARIVSVDPSTDRLEVAFQRTEKDSALKKFGAAPAVAVVDDDTVKKLSQGSTPAAHTPSLADIDEDPPAEEVRVWCDLLGEDICPNLTHTKPTAAVAALPRHTHFNDIEVSGNGKSGGYVKGMSTAFDSYITKPLQGAVGKFDYRYVRVPLSEV
jgi:hypothetical protein